MAEFKYEIIKHIGVLSTSAKGWTKELNCISWNGGDPKYDLRDWAPEHAKMSKGITLTEDEALKLHELLAQELDTEIQEAEDTQARINKKYDEVANKWKQKHGFLPNSDSGLVDDIEQK